MPVPIMLPNYICKKLTQEDNIHCRDFDLSSIIALCLGLGLSAMEGDLCQFRLSI